MVRAEVLHRRIAAALANRQSKSALRSLDPPSYDATALVDFSSNDYLSLSKSNVLRDRLHKALLGQGSSKSIAATRPLALYGPASSRLLDGNSRIHLGLEAQLAKFFHGESALLFNSGFDANCGVFSCLPAAEDAILYDEYIHASTHDGMRASRCKSRLAFRHNDANDLETQIEKLLTGAQGAKFVDGSSQVFVAVETLYSMDGDLAPLHDILEVIERMFPQGNGHLIVDEAHSTGLYGKNGRGLCSALGLTERILIRLHTFGKAMSCAGGVVLCSPTLRNYFINYSRPLIYSTVMSHLSATAISTAISHFEEGLADIAINNLQALAKHTHIALAAANLPANMLELPFVVSDGRANELLSPIIPILTSKPRELSKFLIGQGFLVRPIAAPTVPAGKERVRICLHAGNTAEQIDAMVTAIKAWTQIPSSPAMHSPVSYDISKPLQARL